MHALDVHRLQSAVQAAESAARRAAEEVAAKRAQLAEQQLAIGSLRAKTAQWEQQKKLAVAGRVTSIRTRTRARTRARALM